MQADGVGTLGRAPREHTALDRIEAELSQEGLTDAREAAAATTLEELQRTARQSV
jgi:hypothetical protein